MDRRYVCASATIEPVILFGVDCPTALKRTSSILACWPARGRFRQPQETQHAPGCSPPSLAMIVTWQVRCVGAPSLFGHLRRRTRLFRALFMLPGEQAILKNRKLLQLSAQSPFRHDHGRFTHQRPFESDPLHPMYMFSSAIAMLRNILRWLGATLAMPSAILPSYGCQRNLSAATSGIADTGSAGSGHRLPAAGATLPQRRKPRSGRQGVTHARRWTHQPEHHVSL